MNGLDAAREILKEHPNAAILMLSVHLPGQLAVEARNVGIKGACRNPRCGVCRMRFARCSAVRRISLISISPLKEVFTLHFCGSVTKLMCHRRSRCGRNSSQRM